MATLKTSNILSTGVTIQGITLLSGNSNNNILTISGSNNQILAVSDTFSNTMFSVGTTGGTTVFSVTTGGTKIHTFLIDANNSTGSTNQVLTSTASGPVWANVSSSGSSSSSLSATSTGNTAIWSGLTANTSAQVFMGFSIPANTVNVGTTYSVSVYGTQSQSANANNVTFDMYLNGATVIGSGTVAGGASAQTNRGVTFQGQFTFLSTGASGTVIGQGITQISGVLPVISSPATTPTTVNTTTGMTIQLRATNGTNNAANQIRVMSATIHRTN